jgi:hypothetical protein
MCCLYKKNNQRKYFTYLFDKFHFIFIFYRGNNGKNLFYYETRQTVIPLQLYVAESRELGIRPYPVGATLAVALLIPPTKSRPAQRDGTGFALKN